MKVGIALLFGLLIVLPSIGRCASRLERTTWTPYAVQIAVNDISSFPNAPIQTLYKAMRLYPKARRFRVAWRVQVLGGYGQGTALYDRRNRTVRSYHTGGDESRFVVSHYLYEQVTDEKLSKIARAYTQTFGGIGDAFAHLDELKDIGCKRRVLKSRTRLL